MCSTFKSEYPWKFPASHHITTMFIGGNKKKLASDQFKFFEEDIPVSVDIRAVVYVPDSIVVGVAFPKIACENEFPHMTMMVSNSWKPMDSNAVLQATCSKGGAFEKAYEIVRDGGATNMQKAFV